MGETRTQVSFEVVLPLKDVLCWNLKDVPEYGACGRARRQTAFARASAKGFIEHHRDEGCESE